MCVGGFKLNVSCEGPSIIAGANAAAAASACDIEFHTTLNIWSSLTKESQTFLSLTCAGFEMPPCLTAGPTL